jgi:hypothetical protein
LFFLIKFFSRKNQQFKSDAQKTFKLTPVQFQAELFSQVFSPPPQILGCKSSGAKQSRVLVATFENSWSLGKLLFESVKISRSKKIKKNVKSFLLK